MNTRSLNLGTFDLFSTLVEHLKQRSTFVLLGLGVLVVVAHATFRFPLHLPGHHGLEWMALLVIARQISSYRWAATVAASGAAAMSIVPVLGFHEALLPITYLVPGIVVDLLCLIVPLAKRHSVIFLGIAAALAYATKPLIQWVGGQYFGLPFDGLSKGLEYLVVMHLLFAFAGGSVGALLWQRVKPS